MNNNFKNFVDDNILNIDTERFFREAEDYFFFFNRQDLALKMLKKAIKLSPNHVKSIKLSGDIFFTLGKMEKAFDCYSQAAALQPKNSVILSSLAIVCESLNKYQQALGFVNMAFDNYSAKDSKIYAQICDLKFSLLVQMKKYSEAKKFFNRVKKILPFEESVSSANHIETLKKKLSLQERIASLNIQVV